MRWRVLGATLLLLVSCKGVPPGAALNLAIGAAAAGVSRATGGCYASCNMGWACNPDSGLCEPMPCLGRCKEGEFCDTLKDECRPLGDPDIRVRREQAPVGSPTDE